MDLCVCVLRVQNQSYFGVFCFLSSATVNELSIEHLLCGFIIFHVFWECEGNYKTQTVIYSLNIHTISIPQAPSGCTYIPRISNCSEVVRLVFH